MRRVGLFVGIDQYKNGVTPLRCAVNDAQKLSFAFSGAGYEVDFLSDEKGDSNTITNKIISMMNGLQSGDVFVFYFSGHGREFNGIHYLAGVNSFPDDELFDNDAFPIPRLISLTNKIPGLNRLFILDCCRSNILADKAGTFACDGARDISLNKAVAQDKNASIIPPLILNSCSTGERSFENLETNHGYFTTTLLNAVKNQNIRSFRQFMDNLIITGTPKKQNIAWNGNISYWEQIALFDKWQKFEKPEDEQTIAEYDFDFLKSELEDLMKNNSDNVPSEITKYQELAILSAGNKDYVKAVYFLKTAIKEFRTHLDKCAAEQEAERSSSQNFVLSNDGKTLTSVSTTTISFKIPEGVTRIGDGVFANLWNLKEVEIPDSVTEIGKEAFSGCKSLQEVNLPKNVVFIGEKAFKDCISLKKITIPKTVKTIESQAFENCESLTKIILPELVENLGENLMRGCENAYYIYVPQHFSWRMASVTGISEKGMKWRKTFKMRRYISLLVLASLLLTFWSAIIYKNVAVDADVTVIQILIVLGAIITISLSIVVHICTLVIKVQKKIASWSEKF